MPNDPINGHRNCAEDEHAVQCTLACEDGFAFAFRPTGDYFCEVSGPGSWLPPSNVMPFPDCSVTALSSVISIPTDLKLSVSGRKKDKDRSLCDDTFFLKQVEDHVRQKVLSRLDEVCGRSLYCDVLDLEAICGEVLGQRQVWTNEIFRRKRSPGKYRPYDYSEEETASGGESEEQSVVASSLLINPGGSDAKQRIEIVFKLIGKYRTPINRKETQLDFIDDVTVVQDKIEHSAANGSLDLLLGKELLEMEEITFSPHEFLCNAGAIPQGDSCGKLSKVPPIGRADNIAFQ